VGFRRRQGYGGQEEPTLQNEIAALRPAGQDLLAMTSGILRMP